MSFIPLEATILPRVSRSSITVKMTTRGDWKSGERFKFEGEEYTFINYDEKTGIYYARRTVDEKLTQFLSHYCWEKISHAN